MNSFYFVFLRYTDMHWEMHGDESNVKSLADPVMERYNIQ